MRALHVIYSNDNKAESIAQIYNSRKENNSQRNQTNN